MTGMIAKWVGSAFLVLLGPVLISPGRIAAAEREADTATSSLERREAPELPKSPEAPEPPKSIEAPEPPKSPEAPVDDAAELSVAPITHLVYPEDRPAWVEAENDTSGEVHRWVVRTGPCETRDACEDRLAIALRAELQAYSADLVGSGSLVESLPLDDREILEALVARRYDGKLTEGEMEAFESVLELSIGPELQAELWHLHDNRIVRQRIGALGVFLAGGFVLLLGGAVVAHGASRHVRWRERAKAGNS